MKLKKRVLSVILAFVMCLSLIPTTAFAADIEKLPINSGMNWNNADAFGAYDYSASQPKTGYAAGHYTFDNGDGTVSALVVAPVVRKYDFATKEYYYTSVTEFHVERYDAKGNVVSSKTLPMELPIFGTFLAGQKYNYIAFGQKNEEKDNRREVWRIVQYDKNWNRVAAVSVTGGDTYTVEPFRSTTARMAESADGKSLVLHASRTRYDTHQSNITMQFQTEPFGLTVLGGDEFPANHVSHSFGQFVQYDGSKIVTVDHGDAYPRSFVLQVNGAVIDLFDIYGAVGENVTNAIGSGLEVSASGYLFLGCSDAQNGSKTPWNVFLTYVSKDAIENKPTTKTFGSVTVSTEKPQGYQYWTYTQSGQSYYVTGLSFDDNGKAQVKEYVDRFIDAITPTATLTWLTDSKTDINTARLVRIDANTFAAMWSEMDGLHWQFLNGKGQLQGAEHVVSGVLMPPTQPVVRDRSILWIQTENDKPCLYTLNTADKPAPDPISATGTAYASTQEIVLDGAKIELQAYALKNEQGYLTNYVKLRDIAMLVNGTNAQFNVGWNGAVNIISNKAYEPNGTELRTPFSGDRAYETASAPTKIDGSVISVQAILLKDDQGGGYTYYKLRDIAEALDFDVSWVQGTGIVIDTDQPYTAD
ncbi:MAG: hypothetical protein IJC93_01695 [Clostridia bacterium]|nr:hypothetical protein [Clostridia bacterium]